MVAANKSLAIISIMGRDQKGVVARVSTCLAGGNIDIEDIKARDRHLEGKVLAWAVQLFFNDQLVAKDKKVIFRPGHLDTLE